MLYLAKTVQCLCADVQALINQAQRAQARALSLDNARKVMKLRKKKSRMTAAR